MQLVYGILPAFHLHGFQGTGAGPFPFIDELLHHMIIAAFEQGVAEKNHFFIAFGHKRPSWSYPSRPHLYQTKSVRLGLSTVASGQSIEPVPFEDG